MIGINLRVFSRETCIVVLLCIIGFIGTIHVLPTIAHNNSALPIPISRQPIVLDGYPGTKEWEEAFKGVFISSGAQGNVTVYLKYDLFDRTMDGAFLIPDSTSSVSKGTLDQITFNFDTNHDATSKPNPYDHSVQFGRDKMSEYYKGNMTGGFDTINGSSENEHTILLHKPFLKADFNITSTDKQWMGEFKIYFRDEPKLYGFAIQQTDYHSQMPRDRTFINYPGENAAIGIPASWGDIRFPEINQYLKNIKTFCPTTPSPYESKVLCVNSVRPNEIEEKTEKQIVVSGRFADYINNSGIPNAPVDINIIDSEQSSVYGNAEPDTQTDSQGYYRLTTDAREFDKGKYSVVIIPVSNEYDGLNATAELDVTEHITTLSESIAYLGTIFGVIGGALGLLAVIPRIRQHFREEKQRKNLYLQMMEISDKNETSKASFQNKENHMRLLKDKRNEILQLLKNGGISEEHYRMLDGKISSYEQKVNED